MDVAFHAGCRRGCTVALSQRKAGHGYGSYGSKHPPGSHQAAEPREQRLGISPGAAVSRRARSRAKRSLRRCPSRGRRRKPEFVGNDGIGGAQHRGGKCTASLRNATRIAEALNVSTDFLVGYADDPRRTTEIIDELQLARKQNPEHQAVGVTGNGDGEIVAIVEVDTAAGAGALVGHEHVIGQMKFAREWLRAHNVIANQCRLIRVQGESMEPTLPDKASILVDLARNERRNGKIFVIRRGEDLIVKRTVQDNGNWLLASDNVDKQNWPDLPWPANAAVVGQVCWVSRSLV